MLAEGMSLHEYVRYEIMSITTMTSRTMRPLLFRWFLRSTLLISPILLALTPLQAQVESPHIAHAFPAGGKTGSTFEVTLGGKGIEKIDSVYFSIPGISAEVTNIKNNATANKKRNANTTEKLDTPLTVRLKVKIAADARPGRCDLRVLTPNGVSNRMSFYVGTIDETIEQEPNSLFEQAQTLGALPLVANGRVMKADRDFFRFKARKGQTIVCRVDARHIVPYIADAVPGWLQSSLVLYDSAAKRVAYNDDWCGDPDPVLIYKVPKDDEYTVEIKDIIFRGREDMVYRLTIGELPLLTYLFPLGTNRKSAAKVHTFGVNLSESEQTIDATQDPGGSTHHHLLVRPTKKPSLANALPFAVDDLPEISENEPNNDLDKSQSIDAPTIAEGFIINGRIDKPGDVDCFRFEASGKRPLVVEVMARRLGSPLDSSISIFDAKTGRMVDSNDDWVDKAEGLLTHHADSYLFSKKISAKGSYVVQLSDAQDGGGSEYGYRLRISRPRPDFDLMVTPDNPRVLPGGTTLLTAVAVRRDGFNGEINLDVNNLPKGYTIGGNIIPPGEDETLVTISAPATAKQSIIRPIVLGRADVNKRVQPEKIITHTAQAVDRQMQAFIYYHYVPSDEVLLSVMDGRIPIRLSIVNEGGKILELPRNGAAQVTVRVKRLGKTKGPVQISADSLPKNIKVRKATIPAGKNETTVTITTNVRVSVGFRFNLILVGTLKAKKQKAVAVMAPAIPIKVVKQVSKK